MHLCLKLNWEHWQNPMRRKSKARSEALVFLCIQLYEQEKGNDILMAVETERPESLPVSINANEEKPWLRDFSFSLRHSCEENLWKLGITPPGLMLFSERSSSACPEVLPEPPRNPQDRHRWRRDILFWWRNEAVNRYSSWLMHFCPQSVWWGIFNVEYGGLPGLKSWHYTHGRESSMDTHPPPHTHIYFWRETMSTLCKASCLLTPRISDNGVSKGCADCIVNDSARSRHAEKTPLSILSRQRGPDSCSRAHWLVTE